MNRKFHIKRAEKALENAEFHRIDGEAWAAMYWLSKASAHAEVAALYSAIYDTGEERNRDTGA